jgi:nucleotide-binding universal stress UspA family protein
VVPRIHRIVVPVDFSEASERAIDYAGGLARLLGASLHLIHVVEEIVVASGPTELSLPDTSALRERLHEDARSRLAAIVAKLKAAGPQRVTREIRNGSPAESIADATVVCGADLVVMATHGRTGLAHLLMGSVAERVIQTACCPVLVIRESGPANTQTVHPTGSTKAA